LYKYVDPSKEAVMSVCAECVWDYEGTCQIGMIENDPTCELYSELSKENIAAAVAFLYGEEDEDADMAG